MPASTPADICRIFRQAMAAGDIDAVLEIYDPEVVFLNPSGEARTGKQQLLEELAPLVAAKADFAFEIKQIIETADVALMHTRWRVSHPQPMTVYAIEVARRQRDGTWRWLIGDPFTVGRFTDSSDHAPLQQDDSA
jgi:uncharacterized protein (TIGR02246 family)